MIFFIIICFLTCGERRTDFFFFSFSFTYGFLLKTNFVDDFTKTLGY